MTKETIWILPHGISLKSSIANSRLSKFSMLTGPKSLPGISGRFQCSKCCYPYLLKICKYTGYTDSNINVIVTGSALMLVKDLKLTSKVMNLP